MKYTKKLLYLLFLVSLLITSCGEKQIKQTIINCHNNVNIYYPPGYDKSSHTPSFAILNEPSQLEKVSDSSSLKVTFSEFPERQIAQVSFGSNVDLYGTGEVMGDLIRNGKTVKLWNTDNYGYGKDNGQRLYQSHPWVLGVGENGKSFGVIADNTWKMEISLGERITFSSEGPSFRVIVIEKESPQEVMKELGKLTGTIELPPLWSLGFHQCRYSYYPDERVKSLADTMRLKNIPCDVIWMDIDYMQDFKIFTFDSVNFPNPKETNDYLHQNDFKSVWMIDPGIKAEKGYFVYDSGEKINAWVKTRNDSVFLGKVWPGDCVFPDFTQSKVSKWWGELYENFMAKGVDGVWNDMNEPAVFETEDWTMPDNNTHIGDENIKNDIIALKKNTSIQELDPRKTPSGISASQADKLKKGKIRPERTIDLHGFTQFRAHSYINEELLKCYKSNMRSILIITGKKFGKMGAEGVLKREVPKWLNLSPLKEVILMTSWATPRDGGEGALYVLLRRVR